MNGASQYAYKMDLDKVHFFSTFACFKRNVLNRYSYNIATNADERRDNPTPAQQRINELLQEKQSQKQFDKG